MAVELDPIDRSRKQPELAADFSARLEGSLSLADDERRRRRRSTKLAALVPILLLIGPVVLWKLTSATTGGEHVAVDALVSLTLVLDAGLQVDTAVLTYLHLQALPFIVGAVLLFLTGAWLLWEEDERP
jgi:hypothetical protein